MRRDIFQAIADPTRRAIVTLLMTQALTPNTLAERFDTTRQAVSKHIKVLQECGLVAGEQLGREIYYKIVPMKLKEVADWLEPFRQMWEDNFNRIDDLLEQIKNKEL